MDVLSPDCGLNLDDDDLRIYARNYESPPTYIEESAVLENSMITKGCYIGGLIRHSIISSDCRIEAGAQVIDSVLFPGTIVKTGAVVRHAIVGQGAIIEENCHVGSDTKDSEIPEITVIGDKKKISGKTA